MLNPLLRAAGRLLVSRIAGRITLSLLAASLVALSPLVHGRHAAAQTAPRTYVVLIVLDGGRPGYLNEPNLPTLHALMRSGTVYPNAWAGILESETPSGHAAIATGSSPAKNGVLGFAWANSDNIPTNLFSPTKIINGAMERIMRNSGAPTIASLVHARHPHMKVAAVGGYKYYAVDALGGPDADAIGYIALRSGGIQSPAFIPGHPLPPEVVNDPALVAHGASLPFGTQDHLAMVMAAKTFLRMHARVIMVNLPEFDWPLGHVMGGSLDQPSVRALMQSFDRDLGMLEETYHKKHVLKHTVFIITADHGFTPLHRVVQGDVIDRAVAAAGTRIVSSAYHTGAFIWIHDPAKARQAAENIVHLHLPEVQSVYYRGPSAAGAVHYHRTDPMSDLHVRKADAANRYLLRSFLGPAAPSLVVFFHEGTGATTKAQSSWKADHGGGTWQSQNIPLVIAGQGIRKGYVSSFPARLIDIAPTALTAMGIAPAGMEGVPLADALTAPSVTDAAAQDAIAPRLRTLVTALSEESMLERSGR